MLGIVEDSQGQLDNVSYAMLHTNGCTKVEALKAALWIGRAQVFVLYG